MYNDNWQEAVAQVASLAAASITSTTAATSDDILVTARQCTGIVITNSLDKPVMVTYDDKDFVELPASVGCVRDMSAVKRYLESGKRVSVYHLGSQPTSGRISISVV